MDGGIYQATIRKAFLKLVKYGYTSFEKRMMATFARQVMGSNNYDGSDYCNSKQINYAPNVVNDYRKLDEQNADRAKFNSVIEFSKYDKAAYSTGAIGATKGALEHSLKYTVKQYSKMNGIKGQLEVLGKSGTKTLNFVKVGGKALGSVGVLLTALDANENGLKPHHYADIGIGIVTTFIWTSPIGWAVGTTYFLADMTVKASTGSSITEHFLDPKTK